MTPEDTDGDSSDEKRASEAWRRAGAEAVASRLSIAEGDLQDAIGDVECSLWSGDCPTEAELDALRTAVREMELVVEEFVAPAAGHTKFDHGPSPYIPHGELEAALECDEDGPVATDGGEPIDDREDTERDGE